MTVADDLSAGSADALSAGVALAKVSIHDIGTVLAPGVGFLKPIHDPAAPLLLIKPGSYPWPSEIWRSFTGATA